MLSGTEQSRGYSHLASTSAWFVPAPDEEMDT